MEESGTDISRPGCDIAAEPGETRKRKGRLIRRRMQNLSDYLKKRFGEKVYRLSLTSGCSCPNRDGTLGYGGCTFCSEGGSGEFAAGFAPVDIQIDEARKRIAGKSGAGKFIAYFQSFTNTYGDVGRLEKLYHETIVREDICALSLGTRPDCLGEDVLKMIAELQKIKPVWIELGLQTMHEETARRIRRGYPLKTFEEAYGKLKWQGTEVIIHLPGETREDMLDTVRYVSALDPEPDGVKLQMLQILKGTQLAREYEKEPFPVMDLDEYSDLIAECVSILPEKTVLHRMTGDGPRKLLIEPKWSLDKKRVLNTLNKKIGNL